MFADQPSQYNNHLPPADPLKDHKEHRCCSLWFLNSANPNLMVPDDFWQISSNQQIGTT